MLIHSDVPFLALLRFRVIQPQKKLHLSSKIFASLWSAFVNILSHRFVNFC